MTNKPTTEIAREALEYWYENQQLSLNIVSKQYCEKYGYSNNETMRKIMQRLKKRDERNNDHNALLKHCKDAGIPIDNVKSYWHKTKHFSLNVKKDLLSYEQLRDDIIEAMNAHSPNYEKIHREYANEGHLLVIDPADVHLGKLASAFEVGEDYNNNIAVQRVREGVNGILEKSKGFNIDKILLIVGNDILHIDTPKRQTTSGTPQDTDGMWYDNFLLAKKLYVEVIETLMQVADVHVTFNPSNHDYTNGFFLADALVSWFRLSENITFDCSISHRKYFRYFNNLIGTTHGDGAKESDLGLLMANESKNNWSETKYRYFYTHHVHHKTSKDYIGLTVESLRSPSGTDSWHHRNGYVSVNNKAIEGFIHSKELGQIARITHYF